MVYTHSLINFKYFLISMCHIKCQNILVNFLIHLLEHLSFWLRYPNFLLSKFASQLKLIQSVVRVEILGIFVTSSILRVLLSGFWVSESQFPSPTDPVPESCVWGSRVPGSQNSWVLGPRVQGLRVSDLRVPVLKVLGVWVSGCNHFSAGVNLRF